MPESTIFSTSEYRMADISQKPPTHRKAIAQGRLHVGEEAFKHIKARTLPKGDPLVMAEIVGIQGAKQAYQMLPLCHPMSLHQVLVHTELDGNTHSVIVTCLVSTHAKTGVEMEALAGVNAALLAIYDLTKPVEPALSIHDIRLLFKEGGKRGRWVHPDAPPKSLPKPGINDQNTLKDIPTAALTISNRASAGEYEDQSGKVLQELLAAQGAEIIHYEVVPDDQTQIKNAIERMQALPTPPRLIITTGGTGLSSNDITPDALMPLCERLIPGLGELLRQDGAKYTKYAWLSRSFAGTMGMTLIISLPGSPKAVREGMAALSDLLPHAIKMLDGGGHHD